MIATPLLSARIPISGAEIGAQRRCGGHAAHAIPQAHPCTRDLVCAPEPLLALAKVCGLSLQHETREFGSLGLRMRALS